MQANLGFLIRANYNPRRMAVTKRVANGVTDLPGAFATESRDIAVVADKNHRVTERT